MAISTKFMTISGIASGIVAIAGVFALLDIEIPRPAWAGEVRELNAKVLEIESTVTSQQLDDAKLRLYQNQREQIEWQQEIGTVPEFLLNEQVLLERKVDNLQDTLDDIRGTLPNN